MGVLLIGMMAAPQVMFSNNIDLNEDVSLSDVPGELHNYFMEEIEDGSWLDAKTNGINLNLSGYSVYDTVDLLFNFTFYNVYEFDSMHVSGYGYIDFFDSSPTSSGGDLPLETFVSIMPYWEYMQAVDNIFVWSTPEFCVIQYDNMTNYGGSELGTYQVVLYSDGTIDFNYLEIHNVESPTIGLNFGDGEYYNEFPGEDLSGVTDFTLRFIYFNDGPELQVEIEGPRYTEIGNNYTYTATAWNLGSTNETGLSFTLYLNDAVVNTSTIAEFDILDNATLTYNYTVVEEGLNVFRATITEVPGEHTYVNNEASFKFVSSIERKYAMFQDEWPWPFTTNPDATAIALNEFGIAYDIFPSSSMGNVDLENYTRIIISSSQPQPFYDRLSDNLTWFEDFAADGGILEIHAADQSSVGWVNGTLPGGLSYVYKSSEVVNIVAPWHNLLNFPFQVSEADLFDWGSSIHGHLVNLTIPAQIILTNQIGEPALIEFQFGEGHFIVTTQTVEWAYGERNNPMMLENLLLYRPQEMDHDVLVNLNAPDVAIPGEEIALDLFVTNWGTDTENNVVVTVHVNEEILYSHTIPSLAEGAVFYEELLWTPSLPGTYEITASVEPVTGEEIVANNVVSFDILVRSEVGAILWDEGHGCHERDYYSDWILNLEAMGYRVDGTTDHLNTSVLSDYSALICSEPDVNYWSNETEAIQNFVLNGGGFFVIGDSYQAPLNNLTLYAGIEWLSAGEWGGFTENITAHPVTAGVEEVWFSSPVSYFNLTGSADAHVFLDGIPALAVTEIGAGRIVALADDNCLDADEGDNLYSGDNLRLGNNIINWITEGRTYNIITNVAHVPIVVNSTHLVNVTCDVVDFQGVASVTLFYRVNGSDWVSVEMELVSGTTYQGTIPAQSAASVVEYYISATNTLGYTTIDHNDGDFYGYTVTTPSLPTTTGDGQPLDAVMIIIVAGAGGAVLIIVILYLYKKKNA
ncbi:MAG: CARDB domain-containing protein [Candidatus Thorarchaeota archaeon]